VSKGIALQDVVQEMHEFILSIRELNAKHRSYLLDQISEIEYRLSLGTSETIQLSCLVSICQIVRNEMKK
jgi:replication factor C subunit 3/5